MITTRTPAAPRRRPTDHHRPRGHRDNRRRPDRGAARRPASSRRSSRRPTWAPTASTRRTVGDRASKVKPPRTGKVPTDPPQVSASMVDQPGQYRPATGQRQGALHGQQLRQPGSARVTSTTPPCHRLTTSPTLSVLQCGDPTGTGTGGPGYEFANEYPTDQYPVGDPERRQPVIYPRGTLAMANAGQPGTNGSQFFLVYKDSQLPPQYTAFGTIDETGLATLDKIAAAGRRRRRRGRQARGRRPGQDHRAGLTSVATASQCLPTGQGENPKVTICASGVFLVGTGVVNELLECTVSLGARQLGCDHGNLRATDCHGSFRICQQVPRPGRVPR